MANKIARIVIAIIVIVGLALGIYTILPGQYKNPITQKVQEITNPNAKELVDAIKSSPVTGHKEVTYEEMFVSATANPAWRIKKISVDDAGNGEYEVYADGYKCTIEMDNETNNDSNKTYTNAHVRLTFDVTKNGSEITVQKTVVNGTKSIKPYSVTVNEDEYKRTDDTSYYQGTIDSMCAGLK